MAGASSPESGEILGERGPPPLMSADDGGDDRDSDDGSAGAAIIVAGAGSGCGARKLKKKRKRVLENKGTAADYFDVYGPEARGSVEFTIGPDTPIKLADINGLVTWVLGEGTSPRWAFVKNKPLVRKVALLLLSGLDEQLLQEGAAQLPNLTRIFPAHVRVTAPSPKTNASNAARVLLSCPIPKAKAKKRKKQRASGHSSPPFPPSYYTLSLKDMENHGYPVPSLADSGELVEPEGFAATLPESDKGAEASESRLVAVDCEMCLTCEGLELTRVTLIDEHDTVLLDQLVKPANAIVDYNTRFSGITEEMLAGVTTSLQEARAKVLEEVRDTTLLVGHGLDNDLRALKLLHANCLDTSILYPHPKGPPARSALRYLTEKFLKRSIQQGSHDSVEDARAAMDLAKLKIKHGPGWGVERQETELLVQQLSEAGQRCSLVDRLGSLHKWVTGGASAITVGSDEETVAKVCAEACNQSTDFVWGHLTSLSSLYTARATDRRAAGSRGVVVPVGATALHSSSQSPPDPPGPGTDVAGAAPQAVSDDGHNPYGKQLAEVLSSCDARIGEVWDGLASNTLLLVATGHGDTAEVQRAEESKWRRSQEEPLDGLPRWTAQEDAALQALVGRVTRGLAFAAVKP
eukprot:jgi/Tetstr1/445051/TSEL_032856.t1